MSKPKLILLNGSLGVGKSTLASRYTEDHPLALNLDIDKLWSMLGQWREHPQESYGMAQNMVTIVARHHLQAGHSVILPQNILRIEVVEAYERMAEDCNADLHEILLLVDEDEAIRRFIIRGQQSGHPTGFRPGGLVDTNGREKRLKEMYDEMMMVVAARPNTKVVESIFDAVDATYKLLLETCQT